MNTIRMFAFIASVLLTAFLLRVIAYGLTVQQPIHGSNGPGATVSQSTGD